MRNYASVCPIKYSMLRTIMEQEDKLYIEARYAAAKNNAHIAPLSDDIWEDEYTPPRIRKISRWLSIKVFEKQDKAIMDVLRKYIAWGFKPRTNDKRSKYIPYVEYPLGCEAQYYNTKGGTRIMGLNGEKQAVVTMQKDLHDRLMADYYLYVSEHVGNKPTFSQYVSMRLREAIFGKEEE